MNKGRLSPVEVLLRMIKDEADYNIITEFYLSNIKNNNYDTNLYQYVDRDGYINRDIIIGDKAYTIMRLHYTNAPID